MRVIEGDEAVPLGAPESSFPDELRALEVCKAGKGGLVEGGLPTKCCARKIDTPLAKSRAAEMGYLGKSRVVKARRAITECCFMEVGKTRESHPHEVG